MKRSLIMLLLCLLGEAVAWAIPAYPRKHVITQSDGSQITLVGHGNEFHHYLTDEEGFRVERGIDGIYRRVNETETNAAQVRSDVHHSKLESRAGSLVQQDGSVPGQFRGLVLLVDFNDQGFRLGDEEAKAFYSAMIGQKDFSGYEDPEYGNITCPGSLRDYFCDNSYGRFDPEFDVVGPIHMDVSKFFPNLVDNVIPLVEMTLAAADPVVDFSKYDADGDGDVDMFYLVYAGYSSSYSGNDERLLWPCAATMVDEEGEDPDIYYDGVRMARFACSTEIYGWEKSGDKYFEGIGVMAHEFAHVLGFEDHYDSSGGYQEHPNSWDLMSAGSYNGFLNNTPCALNAYEKYAAGFMIPTDISAYDGQEVVLRSTENSEDACMIHSTQEHVTFFMENRQPDKWDECLAHHGLLVWRVDSVLPEYWQYNYVNTVYRTCLRLVRADGTMGNILIGVEDGTSDPFPGSAQVTSLNNDNGLSNLLSYDKYPAPVSLENITEADRNISFMVRADKEAEARPVTYKVMKKMKVTAEHLEEGVWTPVEWYVSSGTEYRNNEEKNVLYNLIPNTTGIKNDKIDYSRGIVLTFTYGVDSKSIAISAQRVALDSDCSTWFCNISDAEASGSGGLVMKMNYYGLLSMTEPDITLGYRTQSASAYMISQSKFIADLSSYRNLQFEESEEGTGIEEISLSESHSGKSLRNGQVIVTHCGLKYNVYGQTIK